MTTSSVSAPRPPAPPSPADIARWRHNWQHEQAGAQLLHALARRARDPRQAAALERLARREEAHALHWALHLQAAGQPLPPPAPALADRLLLALARRLPPRELLPVVAAEAVRSHDRYAAEPDAAPIAASEREVARQATALAYPGVPLVEAAREHRRSAAKSGSLRAAVFGINDGLVSNLSLVMGVAGATPDNQWILLSGFAGLLAGAFSMGGGEFISMLAQRELAEKELAIEREEIATRPEAELENLARIYEEKGLPPDQAREVAQRLMADPEVALDTIAREQLGLDPQELGSPRAAALASFVSYAAGAAIPLLPFLFLQGTAAILAALVLGALSLFGVGVLVSFFTARNPVVSGLRMLAVGLGAAAVTHGIGRLIGVAIHD
jgi:VIT1/CCC1 family predicted Fe2+/Mn2+ transporter